MGGCNAERGFSELLLLTFSGFLDFFSGFLLFVWMELDAELEARVVEEKE